HGQLLPEQRRLSHRAVPRDDEESVLRRRRPVRRSGRALLERRSHATQRLVAPALRADVPAKGRRTHPQNRASGGGCEELAILNPLAVRCSLFAVRKRPGSANCDWRLAKSKREERMGKSEWMQWSPPS